MKVLLVLAHPCDDSFNAAVAARATTALRDAGHEVDVLDLEAIGFRAAMTADEHRRYSDGLPLTDPMPLEHGELVRHADAIVFVYPTWWSSLPAVLKGWFDRVMVRDLAFHLDERGRIRPALTQLRHIVGISTYGSPRRYVRFVNDNGRRIIARALRLNVRGRCRVSWLGLYAIDSSTPEQRAAFLDRVERRMRSL